MKKKTRVRSTIVDFGMIETREDWQGSAIIFSGYTSYEKVSRTTILIKRPADLAEIRRHLDKIETYWKRQLENIQ